MLNHYYKYLLCILLLIACVLLVILAVLSSNNPGNGKDGTASTHAPSNTSTYWDKDRMESASPASMPQQNRASVKLPLNSRRAQCFEMYEALGPTVL